MMIYIKFHAQMTDKNSNNENRHAGYQQTTGI